MLCAAMLGWDAAASEMFEFVQQAEPVSKVLKAWPDGGINMAMKLVEAAFYAASVPSSVKQ